MRKRGLLDRLHGAWFDFTVWEWAPFVLFMSGVPAALLLLFLFVRFGR